MTPTTCRPARPNAPVDLVAASLITSGTGAELQLVTRDGQRLRLAAEEDAARQAALALWRALDHRD
ncbi:hypothetical protein [Falsiroseomonas sp. HW251]|uniref:hypothetical protein n=1 Tax=Falsiroseomonas sp. HW251 TaxID=3390998 RepID=UPI003D321452